MLKLRNAVLTALLAFCLAMPFVSCSFNDGATGDVSNLVCDVSNLVTEQTGNNQNGGNGGSTGGNENPSGGNNGGSGNENPSGGDSGTDEPGTDYPGTEYPGTDEPGSGEVTEYTVKYHGEVLDTISAEEFSAYSSLLIKDTDYTISGTVITLTDSGYAKVMAVMPGEGEDGGDSGTEYPGTDYPGTEYPGTDYPGTDEPDYGNETMYTVMYNGAEFIAIPESELSDFETVLAAGTDYTISETVITLTESGYEKVMAAMSGAGE